MSIDTVCNGFVLYNIAERVRHILNGTLDAQLLMDAYQLVEKCVLAYQTGSQECASARVEMLAQMKTGWFERWVPKTMMGSFYGLTGQRLAKVREMIAADDLGDAHAELADMAKDFPPPRS